MTSHRYLYYLIYLIYFYVFLYVYLRYHSDTNWTEANLDNSDGDDVGLVEAALDNAESFRGR